MASTSEAGEAPKAAHDFWRGPALLLWIVFFAIGLMPLPVYQLLRETANVVPQRAIVNSEYFITLALALYIGAFCYQRCREMGLTPFEAQDKALQVGVLGLVAFLPFDYVLVLTVQMNHAVRNPSLIYIIGAAKLISWAYLFSLFLRYYALGIDEVFTEIPSMFPSARQTRRPVSRRPVQPPRPSEVTPAGSGDIEPVESGGIESEESH